MSLSVTIPLCCLALALEALVGYPASLYRVLGHPVTWMGGLLAGLERRLNRDRWGGTARRSAGVLTLVFSSAPPRSSPCRCRSCCRARSPASFSSASWPPPAGSAQPVHHVRDVAEALERDGLTAGRQAVSMIVGRNTAVLDEAGVARAAIESLAENFSDGIVAPAFWLAIGGLPGGMLYKAANTADSMIGHRSARYAAFGWAAARFDDAINLPASRLAVLWILMAAPLAGGSARGAWAAVRRDARRHRSPNAGWPEAAFRRCLGPASSPARASTGPRWSTTPSWASGDGRPVRATSAARWSCIGWPAGFSWLVLAALAVSIR